MRVYLSVCLIVLMVTIILYLYYPINKLASNPPTKVITIKEVKKEPVSELVKQKQIIYTKILKKTKRALDRLDIPMFLSSGTCLGYFREGKFIDYDYDIDVGIFSKHYTPKIIKEMKKEGLNLYRILGDRKTGMELSFRMPGTKLGKYAKIDIFLHYFEENKKTGKKYISWFSYRAPKFKDQVHYRVPIFKIKEVEFMGVKVYVPYPTIKYIESHYGEDWMIPKKPFIEYVYHTSPKSIVKTPGGR